jgi:acyl-CoA reductase-like NAD-dependent aldehyde dehydrogenase
MSEPTTEAGATPSPFANVSPVDGSALAPVTATAPSEVSAIVARARAAQAAWAQKPVRERASLLLSVKDRILDRAEMVAKAIHQETGKPEVEALLSEVLPTADVIDYWTESIEELLDATDLEFDRFHYPGKHGVLYREPRGVIALITPWNYPVALPLRTIVPALLAGNTVVFKPSEVAPRSGKLVGELFEGVVPNGVLELVLGGGDVGGALAGADVDLVVFTGRVATGKKIAHACAERVSPCVLELGAKDAAIVLADANLARAAAGVVWGALTNAGQDCASIERVYVEASIAKRFIDAVVTEVRALRPNVELGPLTTLAQKDAAMAHVTAAKAAGATVLVEGEPRGNGTAGNSRSEGMLLPIVLQVENDDSPVMREETFGPVIPIAVVADAEEAIRRTNASRFGLTASLWTKNVHNAQKMARRLRAGIVTINNHAFTGALPAAPWGGQGESGYGVTNSPLALDGFTRPRFVLTDRSSRRRERWWYPYTPAMMKTALALTVLRSGTAGILKRVAALFQFLGGRMARSSMQPDPPALPPSPVPPPPSALNK